MEAEDAVRAALTDLWGGEVHPIISTTAMKMALMDENEQKEYGREALQYLIDNFGDDPTLGTVAVALKNLIITYKEKGK